MLTEFAPTAPRWQTALAKAETLGINRVQFGWVMDRYADSEGQSTHFTVASATAEGERYSVVVVEYQGDVAANCTCKASEYGRPCWHAAACLARLGLQPQPAAPQAL